MKIRRKLVIDVTYDKVRDEDVSELEKNLEFVASNAMSAGHFTSGADHVEVDSHTIRISELRPCVGESIVQMGELQLFKEHWVRGVVKIDLSDFFDSDDALLEWFLDRLSEKLTGSELLQDIRYQVVDVVGGTEMTVEVEGDATAIDDGPVGELKLKAGQMDFTPLEVESADQLLFLSDMRKAGFTVSCYSGRGMYGKETYAVSCEGEGKRPDLQDIIRATTVHLRIESQGKGYVLYV